ncbi:hypothetical protein EIN_250170 [Entamoeba invadens IP1]|uniref:Leucine rich repeat containing protein BspA family protein n=1 Tax=Entamoeba invadens IP1 TaxID=370355 RepID=A0A0A1UEK5_ENTIV|nr:hypothetical protein EIN_250170 [Entamoeba invadens IP1]ELP94923.1 hypothetical protein EIN_250170 [Entamoeba invadens IP1]|eukprot:XP_004261694.1 hypothetical protein EIN_250170 [Entamoeba invadens IP1]
MSNKLEEFFMMNVVLYINSFKALRAFVTVNKKCKKVMERLQINPVIQENVHTNYYKVNVYQRYLSEHYTKDILKLFPNIKTLHIPSYRIQIQEEFSSQIKYIKVSNLSEREFTVTNDFILNKVEPFPICSTHFPFETLHFKNISKFQNFVIHSRETLDFFLRNIQKWDNLLGVTIVVPEIDEFTEDVEQIALKFLSDIDKNVDMFLELHNLERLRIFSSGKGQLKYFLPLSSAKGGLYLEKFLYLRNEELCDYENEIFRKIKTVFKVMLLGIKDFEKYNDLNVPASFNNVNKSINIEEREVEGVTKYVKMTNKHFDKIVITKSTTDDLNISQIDVRTVVLDLPRTIYFNVEIPQHLENFSLNRGERVQVLCSHETQIGISKELQFRYLSDVPFEQFFGLPEYFDAMFNRYKAMDEFERRMKTEAVFEIEKFNKLTTDEQDNFRVFVEQVKDLEVFMWKDSDYVVVEKQKFGVLPQLISNGVNFERICSCEIKDSIALFGIPFTITRMKIVEAPNSIIRLDSYNIEFLECENCLSTKVYLNTTVKSIDLLKCYGLRLECRKGVVTLTHFNSYCSWCTSGKNIVVDYLVEYSEHYEDEHYLPDNVVNGFNYIKGVRFREPARSYEQWAWTSPDLCGIPKIAANIFEDRLYYKEDVSVAMLYLKEIGDYCFQQSNFNYWVDMKFADSLTSLGIGAFYEAKGITSLTLPSGLKTLPYKVFYNVKSLRIIESPVNEIEIEDYALYGCDSLAKHPKFVPAQTASLCERYLVNFCQLKSIEVKNNIKALSLRNYANCTSLTKVILPNSVTFINDYAFIGCSNLRDISFSKSVVFGTHLCFANLPFLNEIRLPTTLTKIRNFMFKNCKSLSFIDIPTSIQKICDMSFHNCSSLTDLVIPASVTKFGVLCFKGCSSLTSLHCSSSFQAPQHILKYTNATFSFY